MQILSDELSNADEQPIIKLYDTFKNGNKQYLVLEYVKEGDLLNLLTKYYNDSFVPEIVLLQII